MINYILESNYLVEYGFGIVISNIIVYLLLLIAIFSIFFMFNINVIQSLSELKLVNTYPFILSTIILILLSIAGVPPLAGFVGKFLLLILIIGSNNYLLFIILGFINMFTLYFYIQNIRFIISKDSAYNNIIKNNYVVLDTSLVSIVCYINLLNILGIFFFEDLLLLINYWSSFMYLK